MRISVAQINPAKGDILKNIESHEKWIKIAVTEKADIIAFPELSLTGYEPALAKKLAMDFNDPGLSVFQAASDRYAISIALGVSTQSEQGVMISMIIFQPDKARKIYSKQILHDDELPYFVQGHEQLIFKVADKSIAPAICYESLQKAHAENVKINGADIYLASVAKSQNGINKAFNHYPTIANEYSMPVIMGNNIGYCDNFMGAGQSAVWNEKGELLGKLSDDKEGLLIYDTLTQEIIIREEL
ncbi:carbon-nitrogen hydrolase family protein [Fulvivirga ligni]|uniref:carbon-nitrogen hydrolase family protein n=1 Tax=Fulvivirga ligni TaxID=2904246 RepID=UPI001F272EE1|nr:carbon-nitrogen hydrolase family protein [Fulvivirga ligni]UII20524.1 carbon-nitrogen hydrolase family protein [Fulvivirga ligni]